MMKIQHIHLRLVPYLETYPGVLQMLVQTLNSTVLSFFLSSSFAICMEWLSLAASTAVFNKTTKVVTFQLTNSKSKKLTQKYFAQILRLTTSCTFYKVTNDQVIHMFNEIGHQPTLVAISQFKKSSLPYVWSFLFGIILRCLIGRSSGVNKAKLEIYSVMAR
ncbi:unnamed protein product [Lactuca virosa]|uniref:Uncharacterized protein n=1 Tax=Lactuca virosa TaxID=75947 RepID=A0AAU9LGQ0_9ASTR|nr:unnamed protein product [Lactuca virosa]